MEFYNPFDKKTEFYKELINQDSKSQEVEYEEITETDTNDAVNDFMSKHTTKGFANDAFKAIEEAKKNALIRKENQQQVNKMFGKLFDDLNKKYGLDVRFDYDSLSNSLEYIINPTNKRALELYLSEAYGRFRVVLYNQYLQAIAALSAQILDPNYILSDSMSYDAKLATLEKLFNFMQTMNEIYQQVSVPDTDMKLEKLSEDTNKIGGININDPDVRGFLEQFTKEVKSNNSNNE